MVLEHSLALLSRPLATTSKPTLNGHYACVTVPGDGVSCYDMHSQVSTLSYASCKQGGPRSSGLIVAASAPCHRLPLSPHITLLH